MHDLESKTFGSFGEFARYLRRDIARVNLRVLAHQINPQGSPSYASYIQQVEVNRCLPSPRLVAAYIVHFALDPSFVVKVDKHGFNQCPHRQRYSRRVKDMSHELAELEDRI